MAVTGVGAASPPFSYVPQILVHNIRRIYTEEKAKVVAAVWGTEFIRFLAALAILHHDDLNNRMI